MKLRNYDILNAEGKIARTLEAASLQDAKAQAEDLIHADGSYWEENRWREVRDPDSRATLRLVPSHRS